MRIIKRVYVERQGLHYIVKYSHQLHKQDHLEFFFKIRFNKFSINETIILFARCL